MLHILILHAAEYEDWQFSVKSLFWSLVSVSVGFPESFSHTSYGPKSYLHSRCTSLVEIWKVWSLKEHFQYISINPHFVLWPWSAAFNLYLPYNLGLSVCSLLCRNLLILDIRKWRLIYYTLRDCKILIYHTYYCWLIFAAGCMRVLLGLWRLILRWHWRLCFMLNNNTYC